MSSSRLTADRSPLIARRWARSTSRSRFSTPSLEPSGARLIALGS